MSWIWHMESVICTNESLKLFEIKYNARVF